MQEEITIKDCIAMGEDVEDKVFEKVVADVNAKHPTDSLLSYFDSLCIDLSQAESIMEESLPRAYGEIAGVFRKQYRALNELEKHCLFTSLMTSEVDEDEIVDSLLWHFEEWMEDRAYAILGTGSSAAGTPS